MIRYKHDAVIAWLLLIILGGLVIHTPVTVWLIAQGAPVSVKAWKEILLAVAALMVLWESARLRRLSVLRDKLLWVIGGYALLHLVTAMATPGPLESVAAGLMIDLRYVLYFAVVYVFLKLYPSYRPSFVLVGVVGAVIVTGFALLQLVLPHDTLKYLGYSDATIKPYMLLDENPDYVRMNSTMRGPNPLGAYAMMVLLGVVAYGMKVGRKLTDSRRKWLHVWLAIGSVVALWVSYSRSAGLGLLLGGMVLLLARYGRSFGVRQLLVVGLLIGSLALLGYGLRDTDMYKNIILHDNPTTGGHVTSDEGHRDSLAVGIGKMLQQPVGAGIGSTGSASLTTDKPLIIENQYLMVAHEVGWLGVVLFTTIWLWVLLRLWRARSDWLAAAILASGAGLMLIGMTWPVLVDDPVSMIWWGLAAAALTTGKQPKGNARGTTTHKKTTRTT